MPSPKTNTAEQRIRAQLAENDSGVQAGNGSRPSPSTHTPLPGDLSAAATLNEFEQLRKENAELRSLIEQAIAQEETFDRQAREWQARESELIARLESQGTSNSDDATELLIQIEQRDENIRLLSEQVQLLESHLQYSQESGASADHEELLRAVRERDELIQSTAARVAELEKQLADVPPPAPTDEELARMADELEKERCQITVLRRELEDEKRQHMEDESDFERQMREMEVSMSRERAEMARQRTELQRLQAEVHSDLDAMQRGDASLKDRLAAFQRGQSDANANGKAAAAGEKTPAASSHGDKDSGFMKRFFGGNK